MTSELPADALGTRRLYRLQIDGFEAGGSGRLSLWLWSASHFRVLLADSFGNGRWSIEVDGATTSWVDLRRQHRCSDGGEGLQAALGLPLGVRQLPLVLLGRLPLPEGSWGTGAGWRDASGWRWTVRAVDGKMVAWTAWERDEPRLWWQHSEGGGVLSARRPNGQIRWREVAVEELEAGEALALPRTLSEGSCFEDFAP